MAGEIQEGFLEEAASALGESLTKMRLRENERRRNENSEYRTCLEGLVSKRTEKWTVRGVGNGSFQVVSQREKQKIAWESR